MVPRVNIFPYAAYMCRRFIPLSITTSREVHGTYDFAGSARNLQPHYNIAPPDTVEVVRPAPGGATELRVDALGPHSMLVEKQLKQLLGGSTRRARTMTIRRSSKRLRRDGSNVVAERGVAKNYRGRSAPAVFIVRSAQAACWTA